jgi:hypothetical protein
MIKEKYMKRIVLAIVMVLSLSGSVMGSDWHLLSTDGPNGRKATVVIHIPINGGTNSASPTPILWSAVLAEYVKTQNDDGTFSDYNSPLQSISGPELAAIRAGTILEEVIIVNFLHNHNNAQKVVEIESAYTEKSTELFDKLKAKLKFWGSSGDLP